MSYQFQLDQSNRSLRFPVIMMAAIVCTVIAAYAFAACGDRTPDQARAVSPSRSRRLQHPSAVPVTSAPQNRRSSLPVR